MLFPCHTNLSFYASWRITDQQTKSAIYWHHVLFDDQIPGVATPIEEALDDLFDQETIVVYKRISYDL